jgi:hypothetical protein
MKLKISIVMISVLIIGVGLSHEPGPVKFWNNALRPMLGQGEKNVREKITTGAGFEVLDQWRHENPSVEAVLSANHRINGFTRQRAEEIFNAPGIYEVEVYMSGTGRADEPAEAAAPAGLLEGPAANRRSLTCIRVVFRDAVLVDYDVWPQ